MHRAYRLLQLLLRLRGRRQGDRSAWRVEYALASQLAADFRSLSDAEADAMLPCSEVLRNVVRNLGSLFGPTAGDIDVKTGIERVMLAGYRRRALVLAASELLINALSHAFNGLASGRIEVLLQRMTGGCGCLRVSDDGIGYFEEPEATAGSIAARLAGVLEGRLIYRQGCARGTIAEIVFPVPC